MSVQQTLTGETTEEERVRPDTFWYDPDVDEYVLLTQVDVLNRFDELFESKEAYESYTEPSKSVVVDEEDEEEDDEPEVVGGEYTVRISYSVEFAFDVTAANETVAEEKARDMIEFGNAAGAHETWDEIDERSKITRDELDEDWCWGDPIAEHLESE